MIVSLLETFANSPIRDSNPPGFSKITIRNKTDREATKTIQLDGLCCFIILNGYGVAGIELTAATARKSEIFAYLYAGNPIVRSAGSFALNYVVGLE